jgi:hypothetical protein
MQEMDKEKDKAEQWLVRKKELLKKNIQSFKGKNLGSKSLKMANDEHFSSDEDWEYYSFEGLISALRAELTELKKNRDDYQEKEDSSQLKIIIDHEQKASKIIEKFQNTFSKLSHISYTDVSDENKVIETAKLTEWQLKYDIYTDYVSIAEDKRKKIAEALGQTEDEILKALSLDIDPDFAHGKTINERCNQVKADEKDWYDMRLIEMKELPEFWDLIQTIQERRDLHIKTLIEGTNPVEEVESAFYFPEIIEQIDDEKILTKYIQKGGSFSSLEEKNLPVSILREMIKAGEVRKDKELTQADSNTLLFQAMQQSSALSLKEKLQISKILKDRELNQLKDLVFQEESFIASLDKEGNAFELSRENIDNFPLTEKVNIDFIIINTLPEDPKTADKIIEHLLKWDKDKVEKVLSSGRWISKNINDISSQSTPHIYQYILKNPSYLSGIDISKLKTFELMKFAIENDHKKLTYFDSIPPEMIEFLLKNPEYLQSHEDLEYLLKNLEPYKKSHPHYKSILIENFVYPEILRELNDENIDEALEIPSKFEVENEKFNQLEVQAAIYNSFLNLLQKGNSSKALELNNKLSLQLSPIKNKAVELFGEFLSYDIFIEIKDLENGTIGAELNKIGIKKSGEAGLLELTEKIRELKSKFAKHNPEELDFENSEFMTRYFLAYTGYQNSEYGDTDIESFLYLVKNVRMGNFPPLRKGFKEVATYQIKKKERSSRVDTSLYRQDFLERFAIILEDIKSAKDGLKKTKPLSAIAEKIEEKKKEIIADLKVKIKKLKKNPRAKTSLSNKIKDLEEINIRSIEDFQKNYTILASFKELESLLRQFVFSIGFIKNRRQLEKSVDDISVEAPTLDDTSWVENFVNHISNRETMAQYFTDKKAKKQFERTINPNVMEQIEILKNGQTTSGVVNMTFSTHRDLYTEISGQMGDACWASEYYLILKDFPNFSSIVMTKDKGGKYEKIVGSSMLIETTASNGDDLLIIRGLNPRENTINSLDIESYFFAVVDYVKKLAENTGKKIAISIDDHSGGHTTNRPVLFNYISNLPAEKIEHVRLSDPQDSIFNDYNLQGDVYLLKV